jgi:hypothetical protein
MPRAKAKPLAHEDEEDLAQAFVRACDDHGGLAYELEELIDNKNSCTDTELDGADPEGELDGQEFDTKMIIQRMRPYSVDERKRILNRAGQLVNLL